jgi:hypothetical protein
LVGSLTFKSGTNCKYGGCIFNDGTSGNYIEVDRSPQIDFETDEDFSISAWIKPNNNTQYWYILDYRNATSSPGYYLLFRNNGKVSFGLVNESGLGIGSATTTTVFDIGSWYHIVGVVDRDGNISIYVNGVQEAMNVLGSGNITPVGDTKLSIGRKTTNGFYLNGTIDEIAIYNRSLTASEVQALYNAGKAKFIEYTSVNDEEGKFGDAMSFDGVDDYVEIPDDDSLDIIGDLTICFWAKSSFSDEIEIPVSKDYKREYEIEIWNGYFKLWHGNGTDYQTIIDYYMGTIFDDQWTYFCALRNHGEKKSYLYINGVQKYTGTYTVDPAVSSYPLRIGTRGSWLAKYFNGTIDDVRIYNRVLTPEEIYQHYVGLS